ncbi:MAG: hypothetical protein WC867_06200 [Candidatus Pacearchaeota archaeon]|jgi:ribosomal protein S3AE
MAKKTTKVLTKRKKFIDVDVPLIRTKVPIIGTTNKDLVNRTIKVDLTRQLKGKSVEAVFKISLIDDKAVANPIVIKLMPYFIRRMIRKRISYVEDSFQIPSQESMLILKPFLITRKKVSRVVRKTLRNKTKNWLEDFVSRRTDEEIFSELLSNKLQKSLSLTLKKTYPLSLCEIRTIQIVRKLNPEEVPKITEKKEVVIEKGLDQMGEIEDLMVKRAEKEIKETQDKATDIESQIDEVQEEKVTEEKKEKPKRTRKKKEENTEAISEEKQVSE